MNNRVFSFSILFLFSILFVNCGDSEPRESPQINNDKSETNQALDACNLLPREEAEAILGIKLKEPELKTSYGTTTECNYAPADPNAGLNKSGNLQIRIEQPGNPKASFSNLREMMGDVDPVNEIGEDAFYAATSQLFVLKAPYQIMITIALFGERKSERKETAIKVAEKILARLQ